MARTNSRIIACLHAAIAIRVVFAQDAKCYYPNGNEAPEKPCSSAEGSACCPDKWQCLDNGLCHYPPDNLFGRYSCTDQSWKAEGCPSNMCTYDMSAAGGESITQCKDHNNDWCCNANAVDVNCCKESPVARPFFALAQGQVYATVGSGQASDAPNLATITGEALSGGGGNNNQPSSTPKPSAEGSSDQNSGTKTNTPSSNAASSTPVTSVISSVSSGSQGLSTIIQTTVIQQPASTSGSSNPSSTSSGSKSKLPVIVGCAVGIPLALALLGILIWLLRKRSQQKKRNSAARFETPDPYANGDHSPDFAGGAKLHKKDSSNYRAETDIPELASQPVGPGRPISTIKGHAELGTGTGFQNGAVPYAPNTLGIGGGTGHTPANSWGSAPPGYSPGMNQNAFAGAGAGRHPEMAEAPDTQVLRPGTAGTGRTGETAGTAGTNVSEAPDTSIVRPPREGATEMNTTAAPSHGTGMTQQQYIPYRPPQQVSELPTVRTPPEEGNTRLG